MTDMYLSKWDGLQPVVRPKGPTLVEIKKDVSERHGVTVSDLQGASRTRQIAWARQEAFVIAYATGRYSLTMIGRAFGGRDHTTVLHGLRAVAKRHETGSRYQPAYINRGSDGKAESYLISLCRELANKQAA